MKPFAHVPQTLMFITRFFFKKQTQDVGAIDIQTKARKQDQFPAYFFWSLLIIIGLCFISSEVWAAVTLEEKIDQVGDFFTKKVFKIGLTISTIIGVMYAAIKHSFGAAMSVLVIAVMLCF